MFSAFLYSNANSGFSVGIYPVSDGKISVLFQIWEIPFYHSLKNQSKMA